MSLSKMLKVAHSNMECRAKDSCPPYRVREVPGMGRGVFASRQIHPGGVILEERPLITLDLNDDLELVNGLPVGAMVSKAELGKVEFLVRGPRIGSSLTVHYGEVP